MFEVDEAARIITEASDPEANIIFGAVINDSYTGEIKITVIAAGFDEMKKGLGSSYRDHQPVVRPLASDKKSEDLYKPTLQDNKNILFPKDKLSTENELDIPAFIRKKVQK